MTAIQRRIRSLFNTGGASRPLPVRAGLAFALLQAAAVFQPAVALSTNDFFGIRVTDSLTGRGVPLVELTTVNQLKFVTDSGGWVAFYEPGLMGERVFFSIKSHGYEFAKDGFGSVGRAVEVRRGGRVTLPITRRNIAERLYRVTGEGIYRDSILLGEPAPVREPLGSGKVAGQDSVFGEVYKNKIYWFWGDTSKMSYPLGHFWMACATSELPGNGGLAPELGVDLSYLVDKDGFSRPVARLGMEHGLIWADGFMVLKDPTGQERLVCHYAHMESLHKTLGHGLAVFNDEKQEFERTATLEMDDLWCFPAQAHPIRTRIAQDEYILTGGVFPNVRVRARWEDYHTPRAYEAFTCLEPGEARDDNGQDAVTRAPDGQPVYSWKRGAKPITPAIEQKLIKANRLKPEEAHFLPVDVDSGKAVVMHRGSVRWNPYRKRWVLLAGQIGGTSQLGEIWYAEAYAPTGPWRRAKKVVSHDRYSFYNPVHHPFFDEEGGRWIYFEGTYTSTFSGNDSSTPRYEYNQVMYRLDLDHPKLKELHGQ